MALSKRLNTLRSPRLYVYLGLALVLAWIASTVLFNLGRGPVGDGAPEFKGIYRWINSEPLSLQDLRGKVVLVDVWTYTCSNCIRTFPYLKDWQGTYSDKGLVIVGVHAPEFEFENITENVDARASDFSLEYPIAQDNDLATWLAYNNRFWPAKYLIDKEGVVRYTHFGEDQYLETEKRIRDLLVGVGAQLADIEPGLAVFRVLPHKPVHQRGTGIDSHVIDADMTLLRSDAQKGEGEVRVHVVAGLIQGVGNNPTGLTIVENLLEPTGQVRPNAGPERFHRPSSVLGKGVEIVFYCLRLSHASPSL
mgnify:CR=1 FL=1